MATLFPVGVWPISVGGHNQRLKMDRKVWRTLNRPPVLRSDTGMLKIESMRKRLSRRAPEPGRSPAAFASGSSMGERYCHRPVWSSFRISGG